MKTKFFVLTLFLSLISFAQTSFVIDGYIHSNEDDLPLESASVYVLNASDSSLITYTISDAKGYFELKNKSFAKNIKLYISFIGFKTFTKNIALSKNEYHLNQIILEESGLLDEVELSVAAPILVKEDTLEFNAESFKTKDDATVEDLLKKLPGVKIGKDGKITVNGKEVKDIKVNGKSFFGDDPTIAIKNLTKDMIEKVQISDSKSKDQAFTGESGDSESKSINLTIKEDKNKGLFGRVSAGIGSDKRNEFAGLANMFNNNQRLSVLIGGNNINSPGFSYGEIRKMYGGARNIWVRENGSFSIDGMQFGGNSGISTSRNYGISFSDQFGDNLEFSFNYFGFENDNIDKTQSGRENILPNEIYFTKEQSQQDGESKNHNISVELEYKKDTTWFVTYKPSLNINKVNGFNQSTAFSSRNQSDTINKSTAIKNNENKGVTFSNEFNITRNYGNKGAFVKLNYVQSIQKQDGDKLDQSELLILNPIDDSILRNQRTGSENRTTNHDVTFTLRQPLKAKTWFLDYGVSYKNTLNDIYSNTYDFNNTTLNHDIFNDQLSNNYDFTVKTLSPFSRLSYKSKKLNGSVTAKYLTIEQKLTDNLRPDSDFSKIYNAFLVNARGNYKMSPSKSIYMSLSSRNRPPQFRYIQTNENVSNPLNIIVGNPNLKPTNTTSLYGNFNNYDMQKGTGFYFWFYGSISQNAIVSKTVTDENLVSRTTYENTSGNYNLDGSFNKTFDIKLDSIHTFEFGGEIGFGKTKSKGYINNDFFETNINRLSPEIDVTFVVEDKFDIELYYSYEWSHTKYSTNALQNLSVNSHTLGIETYFKLSEHLSWENTIDYTYSPNVGSNFQQDFWMWNSSIAYEFMDEKAKLSFKVYDLLNQNINTSRRTFGTVTEDLEQLTLQQYFMVSLSWKFNTLGKKGEHDNHRMMH